MDDTAPVHAVTVDPDIASERAVRAALRISARLGCALSREAAEQIIQAVLACAEVRPDDHEDSGQITTRASAGGQPA